MLKSHTHNFNVTEFHMTALGNDMHVTWSQYFTKYLFYIMSWTFGLEMLIRILKKMPNGILYIAIFLLMAQNLFRDKPDIRESCSVANWYNQVGFPHFRIWYR